MEDHRTPAAAAAAAKGANPNPNPNPNPKPNPNIESGWQDDIIIEVLARLPVRSILRSRCVCKHWKYWTSTPYFIRKHLTISHKNRWFQRNPTLPISPHPDDPKDQQLKPSSTTLRGLITSNTCNGLITFMNGMKGHHEISSCVTNPLMRQRVQPPVLITNGRYCTNLGLGYCSSSKGYKVVAMLRDENTEIGFMTCEVLNCRGSTASSSWRSVGDVPYNLAGDLPVLANDSLHWKIREAHSSIASIVLAFEIEEEKFEVIPHPEGISVSNTDNEYLQIAALDGCLCLCHSLMFHKSRMDIWMLENYNKRIWVKNYSIDLAGFQLRDGSFGVPLDVIGMYKGLISLQHYQRLYLYDPLSKMFGLCHHRVPCKGGIFTSSLVSPKELLN